MVKKIRKKQAAHAELDSYQQQFQNWIFIDFQYHINESFKKIYIFYWVEKEQKNLNFNEKM